MPIARNDPDFFERSIIQTSHFFVKRFIRFYFFRQFTGMLPDAYL